MNRDRQGSPTLQFSVSLILLFLLTYITAYAEETRFSPGGSVRNFVSAKEDAIAVLSLIRLKVFMERGETVSGEFAYEISPRYLKNGGTVSMAVMPPPAYRVHDLSEEVYESGEFTVTQNLDRAFVTLSTSFSDVHIGRQPVAFGAARVVNPTDVIAPFTYSTLATEERPGVDALRLRIPTGTMGELDAGLVLGEEIKTKESAAFVRLKSYVLMTDVSLIAMSFRENTLLGFDMARSVGGASTWAEAAHTIAKHGDDYTRISLGADYKFSEKLYSYLEYHFNGAGAGKADDYRDAFSITAMTSGAVYLLGRHYLAPGLTLEMTPLISLSAGALLNLNDGSAMASPAFSISMADDVTMKLGSFLTLDSVDDSEFGQYPNVFYAALNAYF
jgi:hypothetical protein